AIGDVNGDGRLDMAVPNYSRGVPNVRPITVSLLLGRGDGTFSAHTDYPVPGNPTVAAIADLNGDGLGEFIVGSEVARRLTIFPGRSGGTLDSPTQVVLAGDPRSIAVADLDADGKPDVVLACSGPVFTATVLLGDGAGGFRSQIDRTVAS